MRGVGVSRGVVCALALWTMACSEPAAPQSMAPGYVQLHQAVFAESCAQAACHSGASGQAGLSALWACLTAFVRDPVPQYT